MARRCVRHQARVGAALAAAALAIAGCSSHHALPLGPTSPASAGQHHLNSAIVLEIVLGQPSSSAGTCPAGSASLPKAAEQFPGGDQCYRRLGKPLTITSATVTYLQQPASNQQPAHYGVGISVPATDKAALLAITTKAFHSRDQIATIVGDKTWAVTNVLSPFTGQFEIPAQNANQASQLRRLLVPSA